MSRRQQRRRRGVGIDDRGCFPAERVAAVAVRCRSCRHRLIVFSRRLVGSGVLTFDASTAEATMTYAGPAGDPGASYSFDCERCQTPDQRIARARLEQVTADLLSRCRADDTPRTTDLTL